MKTGPLSYLSLCPNIHDSGAEYVLSPHSDSNDCTFSFLNFHSWLVWWGCPFSVFQLSKEKRAGCEGSPDVCDLSLLELLCFLCLCFMMSALSWLRNKDPMLPRKTVSSG